MKDVSSFLTSEVIEPVITLMLPGWIACLPYAVLLYSQNLIAERVLGAGSPFFLGMNAFFFVLFLGLVCDMFGAWLESDYDEELLVEQKMNKEEPNHIEEWEHYLRTPFDDQPVGHRYLRKVLLRFKFELSAYFALTIAIVGWAGVLIAAPEIRMFTSIVIITSLCLVLYLKSESRYSHRLLCRIRSQILKKKFPPAL